MKETQAKRLGKALRAAREKKGWSLPQTMEKTGLDMAWLHRLEAGRYATPDPVRLLRLAEALDFDPFRINKLTGELVGEALPGVRTYFRSTTPATQDDIDEIERHVKRILAKYGDEVDLDSSSDPISSKHKRGGAS